MSNPPLPYSKPFDLGALSDRGAEIKLRPDDAERAAIGRWLEIEAVENLNADIQIMRQGDDRYVYSATFTADVVQACVITLTPCPAHLEGEVHRTFQLLPRQRSRRRAALPPVAIDLSGTDEDAPEPIEDGIVDLAQPVLEELSLALDPYPKAAGATFEAPPGEPEISDSPFAILEKLKLSSEPTPSPKAKTGAKSAGKSRT